MTAKKSFEQATAGQTMSTTSVYPECMTTRSLKMRDIRNKIRPGLYEQWIAKKVGYTDHSEPLYAISSEHKFKLNKLGKRVTEPQTHGHYPNPAMSLPQAIEYLKSQEVNHPSAKDGSLLLRDSRHWSRFEKKFLVNKERTPEEYDTDMALPQIAAE